MLKIDRKAIAAIDLTRFADYIDDDEARGYFLAAAGEHYKLLAWLANEMKDDLGLIIDVGTYKGCSAIALWSHSGCASPVCSYDIFNHRKIKSGPLGSAHIFFREYDPLERPHELLSAKLIMMDTVHDGMHERKVIDFLIENKWKGVLVLDDIHHFPEQNKLWNEIALPKEDLTDIGHWSGTGIIYFE